MRIRTSLLMLSSAVAVSLVPLAFLQCSPASAAAKEDPVARGRYLAAIAGCNDCHTSGYAQSGGQIPEAEWLTGDAQGWQGPWGTSYATNLRLSMNARSEDEWVEYATQLTTRPPMPWYSLREMAEADLRALHAFVTRLGSAGQPAPAWAPPER